MGLIGRSRQSWILSAVWSGATMSANDTMMARATIADRVATMSANDTMMARATIADMVAQDHTALNVHAALKIHWWHIA
ncbi:hypothetical protein DPMN_049650 [Dreissena polymorpha]|uniref:Uncharacterized protein n=1 Tax=Dreissena polymorpha TaxID=45954 RepID=A0A9D4CER0_DREPO|nr:hypothetical protein DPMN_049650 [Dreissena polymorpha]